MNKEFIPYEQALELKELGFDEPCPAKYNRGVFQSNSLGGWNNYNDGSYGNALISAPLYQQAFRWFMDNHNLFPNIHSTRSWVNSYKIIYWDNRCDSTTIWDSDNFQTREEAELVCLKHLIEIIKNK